MKKTKIKLVKLPLQMSATHRFNGRKFKPVKNEWVKPRGGFWTSSYTPDEEFQSDWMRWLHGEMPHWIGKTGYIYEVSHQAKVIEINGMADLKNLLKVYGYDKYADYPKLQGKLDTPDFEKIAKDGYDGVHLTEEGQWQTRLTDPNLYGWDCESTLWLNPMHLTYHGEFPLTQPDAKELEERREMFERVKKDFPSLARFADTQLGEFSK